MKHDVTDVKLSPKGEKRVRWAEREMPVLGIIRKEMARTRPLKGVRVGACLHVTTETAVLCLTLKAAGADVALCASNPLSTQDDAAAYLVKQGIAVFARKGENEKVYYQHIHEVLDRKPQLTMDDGADLVSTLHKGRQKDLAHVVGGTEETTTGVIRLRSLAKSGRLAYPIVAVNDALTKHLFDNRYGTGQSTWDGILRATNRLVAGKTVVVGGYGWCGRGIAMRADGLGAKVIVVEVNPFRALEAAMDGFEVMTMLRAAPLGDIFVTATGDISVIRVEHMQRMKDGAIVANSGHFNVEVDLKGLRKISRRAYEARPFVEAYELKSGKTIFVLAEGRLVNLSSAEGHPAAVMDMSFANQALCADFMWKNAGKLANDVHPVPEKLDRRVAELKLKSMGIAVEKLTRQQKEYLASWELGT